MSSPSGALLIPLPASVTGLAVQKPGSKSTRGEHYRRDFKLIR